MEEGSSRSEEQQGNLVKARGRQDSVNSSQEKLAVIRKKIIGLRGEGLVKKDESEDSPRTHKSVPMGHANYEEIGTQEYGPVCEGNNIKQGWKRSTQDDEFIKEVETTVGHSKGFTQPYLAKKRGTDKVIVKRLVIGKVSAKKKYTLGGRSNRFLAHILHHHHLHEGHSSKHGGDTHRVREGKAHIQGKSRTGKIFSKKARTGEVLAKKNSVAGRVSVGKATPVVKKVYTEPVCRQGPRQESGS